MRRQSPRQAAVASPAVTPACCSCPCCRCCPASPRAACLPQPAVGCAACAFVAGRGARAQEAASLERGERRRQAAQQHGRRGAQAGRLPKGVHVRGLAELTDSLLGACRRACLAAHAGHMRRAPRLDPPAAWQPPACIMACVRPRHPAELPQPLPLPSPAPAAGAGCSLSEQMAAWMGKPTASRPEVTKHFWAYCKERGLQVRACVAGLWCDGYASPRELLVLGLPQGARPAGAPPPPVTRRPNNTPTSKWTPPPNTPAGPGRQELHPGG